MSWRQSSGRETCNSCRLVVDLGAPLYVGEYFKAYWCLNCAAVRLGKTPDGDVPVHHAPMVGLDEAGAEQMRELREKFAPKVAKTWGEERDE